LITFDHYDQFYTLKWLRFGVSNFSQVQMLFFHILGSFNSVFAHKFWLGTLYWVKRVDGGLVDFVPPLQRKTLLFARVFKKNPYKKIENPPSKNFWLRRCIESYSESYSCQIFKNALESVNNASIKMSNQWFSNFLVRNTIMNTHDTLVSYVSYLENHCSEFPNPQTCTNEMTCTWFP